VSIFLVYGVENIESQQRKYCNLEEYKTGELKMYCTWEKNKSGDGDLFQLLTTQRIRMHQRWEYCHQHSFNQRYAHMQKYIVPYAMYGENKCKW
jgi:hypothetical protein